MSSELEILVAEHALLGKEDEHEPGALRARAHGRDGEQGAVARGLGELRPLRLESVVLRHVR